MYAKVGKRKENKRRAVSNLEVQNNSSVNQGFGFVNNRSENIEQRNLQKSAKYSPQIKQFKIYQEMVVNNQRVDQATQLNAKINSIGTSQGTCAQTSITGVRKRAACTNHPLVIQCAWTTDQVNEILAKDAVGYQTVTDLNDQEYTVEVVGSGPS